MILELAPMEGLTTYIFRRAYAHYYHAIDRYYTPFLSLHQEKEWGKKELMELAEENNPGQPLIPQVLTNSAAAFQKAEESFLDMGFTEVNINLGCPSRTVTAKKKGSGMLREPEELNRFLEEIFTRTKIDISIKTRLGVHDASEWEALLAVYNQYPITELIIHARVSDDFYGNTTNVEAFRYAMENSKNPLCYNGDIFSKEDYRVLMEQCGCEVPVMLGRGILYRPVLGGEIKEDEKTDYVRLKAFHDEIYEGYRKIQSGDRNLLFRMKELWTYLAESTKDPKGYRKKIHKTNRCSELDSVLSQIWSELLIG
ncbi:MAG TPA: tRNA-dihydrouridine synthase family protein [Lachnospiraceae bacterium]|nr:tRNA-dihydrouridine synthase family protein [Lachnospiraceae bacterium]